MSVVFDKNMSMLKARFPSLAESCVNWPRGEPAVKAANGAATLMLGGRYIHSPRDPAREAARLAETVTLPCGGEAAVLLGFGLGYTAAALTKKLKDSAVSLLIVEKRRELFRAALENIDLTELLSYPNLIFVISSDADAIIAGLEAVKKIELVVKNRALCEIDAVFYDEVSRLLETWASKDKINSATMKKFGVLFERNQKKNVSIIKKSPGVRELSGRFKQPALIIAAGPSLDELSPAVLKKLEAQSIIIACDTALRFLYRSGIIPRFVVSADAQFWNYLHIAGLPKTFIKKTALVADTACHPLILRAGFGQCYIFTTQMSKNLPEAWGKGELQAGGSVATAAFDFARVLGATEIRIAGLDLAFPSYRTHYKGAVFEERSHNTAARFRPAETQSAEALRSGAPFYAPAANGAAVLTDKRLSLYAAWFEKALRDSPSLPVYSFSQNGLLIRGLKLEKSFVDGNE